MFLNSCNRFQKVVLSQWARVNSTLGLWHDINFKRESLNKVINNERTTYVCHLPSFIWLLLYCMSIFDGYAFDSLQFSKNNRLIILFFCEVYACIIVTDIFVHSSIIWCEKNTTDYCADVKISWIAFSLLDFLLNGIHFEFQFRQCAIFTTLT